MDLLLATQAEQSKVPVIRPTSLESTALGAAKIAGLAEGVWANLDELAQRWRASATFFPTDGLAELSDDTYRSWCDALDRSRGWV